MNFNIWNLPTSSTATSYAVTSAPLSKPVVKEYMGIACNKCYKPIDQIRGSDHSKFCQCDNSEWLADFETDEILRVFKVEGQGWVGADDSHKNAEWVE